MPGTVGTAALLGLMAMRGVTGVTGVTGAAGPGAQRPAGKSRWGRNLARLRNGPLARLRGAGGRGHRLPARPSGGRAHGRPPSVDGPSGSCAVPGGGPATAAAGGPSGEQPAGPDERGAGPGTGRPARSQPADRPPSEFPPAPGGVTGTDVPAPSIPLQLHALQALCRQVFGFRLAVIAIGAPFSLSRTSEGPGAWLVGGAVLLTFLVSYVLLRDWERFGPVVLRHPALLVADALCLALLLLAATPDSPVGYATVSTPLLGGLLYGWRGAGVFTGLQLAVLSVVQGVLEAESESTVSSLLLAGFCVAAGVVGVTLRNLMFRFGAAGLALSEARSRLAASDAVEAERARLAREMHDSVAKTLHGLALAADGLAGSAVGGDPESTRRQAEQVAAAARQAASESRGILSELRRGSGSTDLAGLAERLDAYATGFTARTGLPVRFRRTGEDAADGGEGARDSADFPVPAPVALHVLAVVAEAVENAHRHAEATLVEIGAGVLGTSPASGAVYCVSVRDDGKGLWGGFDLEVLRSGGHFGVVGMVERAARAGGCLRIGASAVSGRGTEVRLELPLAAVTGRQAGDSPWQNDDTTESAPPGPT